MNGAFETLQSTPRGFKFQQGSNKGSQAAAVVFKMIGIGLIIAFAWTLGSLNEQQIADGWERYKAKAKEGPRVRAPVHRHQDSLPSRGPMS